MRILKLKTKGMECRSCEQRIESAVRKLSGIISVKSDYAGETTAVEYHEELTDEKQIRSSIESLGFIVEGHEASASERFGNFAIALGVFAILAGGYLIFRDRVDLDFTNISMETGFLALFILGFFTGFHCIGMCGGFVLSYSRNIKRTGDYWPHLQYGAGKTLSYTVIGALFGLLGSFIAFTLEMRAGVAIIAGIFLVVYGLNMLNIIPALRKIQLRIPSLIPMGQRKNRGPLYTGLLNGLMIACGPLQALYIFAAGLGNPLAGAQALFFFGLGTLAPLLTFGIASNFLSATLSHNVVRFSGVLVMGLGLMMSMNGLNLLGVGISLDTGNSTPDTGNQPLIVLEDGFQVIEMNVTGYGWEPNSFVLQAGVPVRWKINGQEINGCNNEIIVREYGLDLPLSKGMQTIEFTPKEEGIIRWSCWMGMIPGQFVVVNDAGNISEYSVPEIARGSSCGGSGGCGCGG